MILRTFLVLIVVVASIRAAEPLAPGGAMPALPVAALDGTATTLAQIRGQGPLVLMAWCSSCHSCRGAEGNFNRLAADCAGKIPVYALASNPKDTADTVRARQTQSGVTFPVVLDRDGAVADAFGVTCTTTVLVIAKDGTLAYRGPLQLGGKTLARDALRNIVAGKSPAVRDIEQQGCPIR